jgi:flagellar basal body P-ring formation chaperone FlgA
MRRNIVERWMWLSVVTLSWVVCAAQPVVDRTPIASSDVVIAMANAGVQTNPAQVEFLSSVNSVHEHASLKLVSLSKMTDNTMKAHLRCESNVECLPFYVVLHYLNAENIPAQYSPNTASRKVQPIIKSSERVIRGGQAATMIYEAKDIKIVLPIVCLQNGRRGERIRVASPDHKKIYLAEVIDNSFVKGIL